MQITLFLDAQNKLQLRVETDRFHMNPHWAIDWAAKEMPESVGIPTKGFNRLSGSLDIPQDKITSFLNAYINGPDADIGISRAVNPTNPNINPLKEFPYHTIASQKEAATYCSQLASLVKQDTIQASEFDALNKESKKSYGAHGSPQGKSFKERYQNVRTNEFATESGCKQAFLDVHERLFKQDKQGMFGGFRRTKVDNTDSLSTILERAAESNNRSRTALVELGWMDKNGKLTAYAPQPVIDSYPKNPSNSLVN